MKKTVQIKSYTRKGEDGKDVVVKAYEQQRRLSEKEIREIQDYMVKEAPKHGYEVFDTGWSDTSDMGWGISAYVMLWRPKEKFNLKVRISDHSIGHLRMLEEQSIVSMDDARSFLNAKWEKITKTRYPERSVTINPEELLETDIVKKKYTTSLGLKKMTVRRKFPYVQTYYQLKRED